MLPREGHGVCLRMVQQSGGHRSRARQVHRSRHRGAHPKALGGAPELGQAEQLPVVGAQNRPATARRQSADNGGIGYSVARAAWRQAVFAQKYPNETQYRHALAEEVAALDAGVNAIERQKAPHLDPQLANVLSLKRDGLLEAWILLSGGPNSRHRPGLRRLPRRASR